MIDTARKNWSRSRRAMGTLALLAGFTLGTPAAASAATPNPNPNVNQTAPFVTIRTSGCTNGRPAFSVRIQNLGNNDMTFAFTATNGAAGTPSTATIPAGGDQTVPLTLPTGSKTLYVSSSGVNYGTGVASSDCGTSNTPTATSTSSVRPTQTTTSTAVAPAATSTSSAPSTSSTATSTTSETTTPTSTTTSAVLTPSATTASRPSHKPSASPSPSPSPSSVVPPSNQIAAPATLPSVAPAAPKNTSDGASPLRLALGIGIGVLGLGVAGGAILRSFRNN